MEKQVKNNIEPEFDASVRRLFVYIKQAGASAFSQGDMLEKYRESRLLANMIRHFEETEEYEKCTFLKLIAGAVANSVHENEQKDSHF